MPINEEQSLSLLRDALTEAQATVRAYDTKAQIVGVGYVFALGIVGSVEKMVPNSVETDWLAIAFAWVIVILPILFFGYVLYPTRKTAPSLDEDPVKRPEFVLYVDTARHYDVEALKQSLRRCDPVNEFAFEVLKLSKLRELKRQRFLRALFLAAAAFVLVFTTQMLRVQGWL